MEGENFKYYAFISYSHKDKKVAQRLHNRLRSYHLPSKLVQSHPELPKKLGDIFLDETVKEETRQCKVSMRKPNACKYE